MRPSGIFCIAQSEIGFAERGGAGKPAGSLPMPELREFTCGAFRPVAARTRQSECRLIARFEDAPA